MHGASPGHRNCVDDCLIAQAVAGFSVGVVLLDSTDHVAWLNRAAEKFLGVPAGQCVGRLIASILKDPQLASFWEAVCSNGDRTNVTEVSVRRPEPLELRVIATRCTGASGAPLGRALLFCDVTADRSVQVELSQAVAKRLLVLTSSHMPPDSGANLTQQEVRVLRLVGRGSSNDDIAGQMGISASTVRAHLKSVYRKLNLASRTEAVSYAIRNSLA